MATTRLMPLHIGKGKTIQSALGRAVDYVENPNKTNDGELISAYGCDPLIVEQEFLFSKSEYKAKTGRIEGDKNVIAYHLRQSFKPDEVDAETANKIGYDLAMSLTKGNHAFIVCTHVDKKHIHSHIIFNSTNLECNRKFRNFWGSSMAVRKISDKLCLENGLSIIENPKPSRGSYATWLSETPMTYSDKLRITIDEILETKPSSFEEFLQAMKGRGYEHKTGKYIAFKGNGQKKFIRLYSLGEVYSEESIRAVIDGKILHKPMPKVAPNNKEVKVNLLVDIQAKLNEGKGAGYEQWANIFNAKQTANTINYMRENNLDNYYELASKVDEVTEKFNLLTTDIKKHEAKLE